MLMKLIRYINRALQRIPGRTINITIGLVGLGAMWLMCIVLDLYRDAGFRWQSHIVFVLGMLAVPTAVDLGDKMWVSLRKIISN